MRMNASLNYVYRDDVSKSFENDIIESLSSNNIALLGFPGVGKSAVVRAIAAKYNKQEKPVVILTFTRAIKEPTGRIEMVDIDNREIAIPIITIPSTSTSGEEVLKAIVSSLNSIHRHLEKLTKYLVQVKKAGETLDLINKITKELEDLIQQIPENPLEVITTLAEATPYIGALLKISQSIFRYVRKKDLEKLEETGLLVLVDDIADLRPNWQILSDLLTYDFRYLFVIRVETPNDYLSLLTDKLFVNKYLENVGIPFSIKKRFTLPPPSFSVFDGIMTSNRIRQERIHELWRYTGGIPAVALMMGSAEATLNLDQILTNVKSKLDDKSLELPWKEEDIETRLAYTLYATKTIYEELRRKNYSYVALASHPYGLAADELALFCACKFNKIYTHNRPIVSEVYELLCSEGCCNKRQNEIEILNAPYVQGSDGGSYKLDGSLVEQYQESWTSSTHRLGEILNEALPTVDGKNGIRNVYTFNNLFKHIPVLLKEIAKNDEELSNELDSAKKTLLQVMDKELRFGSISTRMIYSALSNILEIEDLSEVQDATVKYMTIIFESFPLEGLRIGKQVLKKLPTAVDRINQLDLAQLLYSLTGLSRRTLSQDLIDQSLKISNSFAEYETVDDRRVFLFIAISYANIAVTSKKKQNHELGEELQKRANEILSQISSIEDSISLFARINLSIKLIDYFYIAQNFEEVEKLLKDAENGLNKIMDLNPDELNWLQGSGFNIKMDLFRITGELHTFYGRFLYDSDRIREAIERYEKSLAIHTKLNATANVYELRSMITKAKLMNHEYTFALCLDELANIDIDIIRWMEEMSLEMNSLSPKEVSSLHAKAVLARSAIDAMKGENSVPTFNESLISILRDRAKLYAGIVYLDKLFKGTSDVNKFLGECLLYMANKEPKETMPIIAFILYTAMEENREYVELKESGKIERVTLNEIIQELINAHDKLYEQQQDFYLTFCCKPYNNQLPYGVFAEVICTESSLEETTNDIVFGITCHLLYDNHECAQLFLTDLEKRIRVPLYKRVLRDLRNALMEYNRLNTEESDTYRMELAKAFLKMWYCIP